MVSIFPRLHTKQPKSISQHTHSWDVYYTNTIHFIFQMTQLGLSVAIETYVKFKISFHEDSYHFDLRVIELNESLKVKDST